MSLSSKRVWVIRPFSSKRGSSLLLVLGSTGVFFAAIAIFVSRVAPGDDAQARALTRAMEIAAAIMIILGAILYFAFPRVRIIFDPSRKEAMIKGAKPGGAIPFGSLQPFRVYELVPGHAHQYFCSNASFGEYADLFFSASLGRTLKRARRLAALTGAGLVDREGRRLE
jgi:hypothetical protein